MSEVGRERPGSGCSNRFVSHRAGGRRGMPDCQMMGPGRLCPVCHASDSDERATRYSAAASPTGVNFQAVCPGVRFRVLSTRGQQHSAVSDREDPCTEFKVWAPVEAWGSA